MNSPAPLLRSGPIEPIALAPHTHGLWEQSASSPPSTQPLTRDLRVDVAIVGAGYTGLSTALHLAEGGAGRVAVIEAADIGFGASGRNAGLVNAGAWIQPEELPRRLGPTYGPRLLSTLSQGPDLVYDLIARHGIDCAAVRNGNLHCAVGQSGLANIRERARQWRSLGVEVHLLDASETARAVGTEAYTGALLDPRTGTIQPLSYVRGLAKAALAAGATIHTRTPVANARYAAGLWQLTTTTGQTVSAEKVVVATNTAQGIHADAWPQLQTELIRLPYFNLATNPLPERLRTRILPQGHGAWDTAMVLSSFRLDSTGRLIYGSVGALKRGIEDAHVAWARRSIGKLFPELKGIGIQHQWHGWVDSTSTHLPYLHQLAAGVWACCGFNGRGIGPGTILGRELADMLLGRLAVADMSLPVTEVQRMSHKALREAFYETGSTLAHSVSRRF